MSNKYKTFALDENWDTYLNDEDELATLTSVDAIGQNIGQRLKFFLAEWEYEVTQGTDWFGKVLVMPVNIATAESELKKRILNTPGVIRLTAFALDFDKASRVINGLTYTVKTEEGIISGEA